MNNIKALVLLSGGLDSMLAVKLMQAQKIDTEALAFASNFFDAKKAESAAKTLAVKLHVIDIRNEMLALVKNPPNGYGRYLNPCLDCHGLMFRLAGKKFKPADYFLASGEVLGQRPFSQNKEALLKVQKLAGQEILRPLSAKLLPETRVEAEKIVNRNLLFGIYGRVRDRQTKLAEKFRINGYPTPAGGCLLADPAFSDRLNKLINYWPDCAPKDVELLKYGRIFWLALKRELNGKKHNESEKVLVVVGRDEADNKELEKLAQNSDFMVQLKSKTGPTALARIKNQDTKIKNKLNIIKTKVPENINNININNEFDDFKGLLEIICQITGYYSVKTRAKEEEFIFSGLN